MHKDWGKKKDQTLTSSPNAMKQLLQDLIIEERNTDVVPFFHWCTLALLFNM